MITVLMLASEGADGTTQPETSMFPSLPNVVAIRKTTWPPLSKR